MRDCSLLGLIKNGSWFQVLWNRSLRNGATFFLILFLLPLLAFPWIFPCFVPVFLVSHCRGGLAQQESRCSGAFSNLVEPSTLAALPSFYSRYFLTSAFHNTSISFTWHMPTHLKNTVHSTRKVDIANSYLNWGLGSVSAGYRVVRLEVSARQNWPFSWIQCLCCWEYI